jgi:Polyketide cyclase / dehydrase and lipid transport
VGTRVRETRRIHGLSRTFTWEVTEYDPGRRYTLCGIDRSVRARVLMDLTPVDEGARTRVAIELAFGGVGIGKIFAPLAPLGASKEVGLDGEHLKSQLEAGLT